MRRSRKPKPQDLAAYVGHDLAGCDAAVEVSRRRLAARAAGPATVPELAYLLVIPLPLIERYARDGRIAVRADGTVTEAEVRRLAANLSAYRRERARDAAAVLDLLLGSDPS